MVFGAIGGGYFLYGKKQQNVPALIAGVALMLYPYFFDSVATILIVGLVIAAIPIAIAKGLV
jgi:hypothetical protein